MFFCWEFGEDGGVKTHQIISELELPLPIAPVFDFFAKAENLERITPPELHFYIVSEKPVRIYEGAVIEYRLTLYGIGFSWRTLISRWIPGTRFVDEQIKGPYSMWRHAHDFSQTPLGTMIIDRVTYALPLYPIGELALPMVRKQLQRIFTYRQIQVIGCLNQDPSRCRWHVDS